MVNRIRRTRVLHVVESIKPEEQAIAVPALKYAVHPGTVFSVADGQNHFIPSDALIQFYGVKPEECLVVARNMPVAKYEEAMQKAIDLKLIPLVPQITGNYAIPSGN